MSSHVISVDAVKLDGDDDTNALQVKVAYRVKGNRTEDLTVVDETIVSGR